MRNYCKEKFSLSNLNIILENKIKDKNISEFESLNECYEFINYIFDNLNNEKILDISLIDLLNKNNI